MLQTKTIWSETLQKAWKLPEDITVSRWADKNRILPASCAFPGPYRSALTPYMREPMDAFCDDEVEEITLMFASQTGKSCAIQNMVGYAIDQDPGPAFYVVPTENNVNYISGEVFRPMVGLSPALRAHTTGSPRDLRVEYFIFDLMTLWFGWAGSAAELAAKYIRYLFLDETSKFPPFAGKEASPEDLADKRTMTFEDRKIVRASTPITKDDNICYAFDASNKQKHYEPCPHCGEYRIWVFPQLKVHPKLRDPEEIIEKKEVWYECEVCAARIYEDQKTEIVTAGKWLPEGRMIDADGNIKGLPKRTKRHSGFHASSLISPFPKSTWPHIMARWFLANTEEGIARGKLLDFNNAILGKPYEETGRKVKTSELVKLRGGFSKATVPADCIALVASADYHKSKTKGIVRIDYEVRGFGYGMKNYVIKSGWVPSFDELDKEVLMSPFPWSDGTASEAKPWLATIVEFVDSSYESDEVYEYCRQRPGLTIPTRGLPGPCLKPLKPSDLESATERRLNRRQRIRYRGMQLLLVDTYYFKNQVTSWVEAKRDEDGKIIAEALTLFYDEIPEYYFREFGNEQLVKVRDTRGNVRWVWQPVSRGAPTHSLDTAVLCAAAAYYKGLQYLRRPGEKKKPAAAGQRKRISLLELQRKKRLR